MGLVQHNAVIAVTWDVKEVERIREYADGTGYPEMFLFGPTTTNGYTTVVLVPDGSKEGWATSEEGDKRRVAFIRALKDGDYPDGSSPWEWVEIGFGELGQEITHGNSRTITRHGVLL